MDKIAFTDEYKKFCEEYNLYTESGNYSTTAEAVYRFISGDTEFIEEHTALADSEIECEILAECVGLGCEWNTDYKVPKYVPRNTEKVMTIIDKDNTTYQFAYTSKRKLSGQDGFRLYYKEDKTAE
jgi:histidinol phosphatase-like PHP family hydrolase